MRCSPTRPPGSRRIIRRPSWPPCCPADMEHTDKVVSFIDECAGIGLEVLPPDVNDSMYRVHGRRSRHDPLRSRRDQGRGRGRGRGDRRRARARRRVPRPCRPLPARGSPARGQAHTRGDAEGRLLRLLWADARDRSREALPAAIQLGEQRTRAIRGRSGRPVRWACGTGCRRRRLRRSSSPRCRNGARRSGSRANAKRSASFCPAIRSRSTNRSSGRSRRRASWTSAGRGRPPRPAASAAAGT